MRGTAKYRNTTKYLYCGGNDDTPHTCLPGKVKTLILYLPGPDWQPKQAHMADLQAVAAAKNLVHELNGGELDSGTLVTRTNTGTLMFPSTRLLHWSKRLFEWWCLRRYR